MCPVTLQGPSEDVLHSARRSLSPELNIGKKSVFSWKIYIRDTKSLVVLCCVDCFALLMFAYFPS